MRNPPPEFQDLLAHRDYVSRLARRLVRDESAAEDLEQETWLAALRHPPRHGSSPRGWLAAVLRSCALDRNKAEGRRSTRERIAFDRSDRAVVAPPEELAAEQSREVLASALAGLPSIYAEAIQLRFGEELPPREMAQRLGVPGETARTRVKRGVALLREDLDRRYGDRRSWVVALAPSAGIARVARNAAVVPALVGLLLVVVVTAWLVGDRGPALVPAHGGGEHAPVVAGLVGPAATGSGRVQALARSIRAPVRFTQPPPSTAGAVPALTVTLEVLVCDANGDPVAGAQVLGAGIDDKALRVLAATDHRGRALMTELPRGMWLGARRGRWHSCMAWLDGPATLDGLTLDLFERLPQVEGRVFDEDGNPAHGAQVRLLEEWPRTRAGVEGLLWRDPVAAVARTRPDGAFTLIGPRAPRRWIDVRYKNQGWRGPAAMAGTIQLRPVPAAPEPRRVAGRVRDGENSVEGWTVRASQPDPAEGPQGLLLPASGIEPGPMQSAPLEAVFPVAEDGTFELTLPPGASDPVELVDPQGFVRDRRSPPSGEREFVLEIGTLPRIRALLAAEPEGWLVVDDGDGRPQVLTSAGTDLDLPVAAGEGNLSLWRAGAPPLRLADWSIQEGALHDLGLLEVPSLGSLELIVREPGGARPLNFSVLIDGDDQLRAANSLRPRRGISFDGAGARVAKLPPGTWSVTVKSPGHVRAQASVVLGSGDHRRVELDLVPGVLVGLELDLPGFTRFGGEIVIEVLDAAENVVATERLDLPARPTLVPWSILLPEGEYEIRALTSSRGAGSLRVSARPALSGRSQGVLSME